MGRTMISDAAIGDSGSLLTLFSRCSMNPQPLGYSIRRPAPESAFRRDREVFHIFFCRCQAPARADQSVGVMHEAETQLGLGAKFEPIERREVPIIRAIARNRHMDQLDAAADRARKIIGERDPIA